jgi:hypothetical protein
MYVLSLTFTFSVCLLLFGFVLFYNTVLCSVWLFVTLSVSSQSLLIRKKIRQSKVVNRLAFIHYFKVRLAKYLLNAIELSVQILYTFYTNRPLRAELLIVNFKLLNSV